VLCLRHRLYSTEGSLTRQRPGEESRRSCLWFGHCTTGSGHPVQRERGCGEEKMCVQI
jgi:hypothetical protein